MAPNSDILLASRGLIGFCLGVTSSAVMAYTYENQKQIGRFASYGALGWLFGSIVSATIQNYHALFLASAIASVIACIVSFTFKEEHQRIQVSVLPLPLIKENRRVLLGFALRQLGANAIWAIFPLYLVGIGASRPWIAILEGINVGMQFFALRFVERFDPVRIFRVGLLISVANFVGYGLANHYLQVIPIQILLATSWSFMLIGALSYLLKRNPERGTVSGLLYSTIHLSAGLGPFIGGGVSQIMGYAAVMYVGSGLTFLGFLSSRRLNSHRPTSSPERAR